MSVADLHLVSRAEKSRHPDRNPHMGRADGTDPGCTPAYSTRHQCQAYLASGTTILCTIVWCTRTDRRETKRRLRAVRDLEPPDCQSSVRYTPRLSSQNLPRS
jgi:hypothetical protein